MRSLLDPDTGELVEVLCSDGVGTEPYSYETFRRAAMTVSREHRAAIQAAEDAGKRLAAAESEYHKQLALASARMKREHGATVAETMAKGEEAVYEAKETRDGAEVVVKAAHARVRLAESDKTLLLRMGNWSQATENYE